MNYFCLFRFHQEDFFIDKRICLGFCDKDLLIFIFHS